MNAGSFVETLKPYHMLKNLFELIVLNGDRDGNNLGISACAQAWRLTLMPTASTRTHAHAHEPPGETFTT